MAVRRLEGPYDQYDNAGRLREQQVREIGFYSQTSERSLDLGSKVNGSRSTQSVA